VTAIGNTHTVCGDVIFTECYSMRHQWALDDVTHSINISMSPTKINNTYKKVKVKQSAPLQVWSGPEGSRKLRFPDLMTTAQDGGKVVSLRHRPPLAPGNTHGNHFC
jgi:hypothetical protein